MSDTIPVASASRPGLIYQMVRTPEGFAIHDGEDCEAARFGGILTCPHSKAVSTGDETMTQALVRAEAVLTPAPLKFNDDQMSVIKQTIAKGATDAELALFVATCERTGLDPFMKQIYAIKRGNVMGIQVGIDGMRLIAERTDKYAGQDEPEWLTRDGEWTTVFIPEKEGDQPLAARVRVFRKDWPDHAAVGIARFGAYVQDTPLWRKMGDVMIAKCAESQALRKAFPAEMSAIAGVVGEAYDPSVDVDGYVEQREDLKSEDQKRPQPTRKQLEEAAKAQAIEGEVVPAFEPSVTPEKSAQPAPTTANAPATPPAPPEPATQGITKDTQNAIARVMTDVGDTQGDNYVVVYKDLMAAFPEAVIDGRLRGIKNMTEDRALEMLSRLRVWQAGEDPGAAQAVEAALPPEPEEGVWEEAPQ